MAKLTIGKSEPTLTSHLNQIGKKYTNEYLTELLKTSREFTEVTEELINLLINHKGEYHYNLSTYGSAHASLILGNGKVTKKVYWVRSKTTEYLEDTTPAHLIAYNLNLDYTYNKENVDKLISYANSIS